jgi:hypothetical protein
MREPTLLTYYDPEVEALYNRCRPLAENVNRMVFKLTQQFERALFEYMRDNRITFVYYIKKDDVDFKIGRFNVIYNFYKDGDSVDYREFPKGVKIETRNYERLVNMPDAEFDKMIVGNSNADVMRQWRNAVRG